jgi:hypothetical protein
MYSSWGHNDDWCGKEIESGNVEWIRPAQDGDQRHSNLQLKAMQFVVTPCCIATRKVAELFRFSSARRSVGSGVQPAGVVVMVKGGGGGSPTTPPWGAVLGTWSDAFTAPHICS